MSDAARFINEKSRREPPQASYSDAGVMSVSELEMTPGFPAPEQKIAKFMSQFPRHFRFTK